MRLIGKHNNLSTVGNPKTAVAGLIRRPGRRNARYAEMQRFYQFCMDEGCNEDNSR